MSNAADLKAIDALKTTLTVTNKASLDVGDYVVYPRGDHYLVCQYSSEHKVQIPRDHNILFNFLKSLVGERALVKGIQYMVDVWGSGVFVSEYRAMLSEHKPAC